MRWNGTPYERFVFYILYPLWSSMFAVSTPKSNNDWSYYKINTDFVYIISFFTILLNQCVYIDIATYINDTSFGCRAHWLDYLATQIRQSGQHILYYRIGTADTDLHSKVKYSFKKPGLKPISIPAFDRFRNLAYRSAAATQELSVILYLNKKCNTWKIDDKFFSCVCKIDTKMHRYLKNVTLVYKWSQ